MLRLFKVTYEKIDGKELPKEIYNLYNDEIEFYVLAGNIVEASNVAWLYLPEELEDYFEEVSIYDIQGLITEYNFIRCFQEELKMAKNLIINWDGCLNDTEKEYFDKYLKEK